ncbi:unnamed protein product [Schistosoma curassoni]|nr:unnamed protein product [Schistosoma curassoni]
MSWQSFLTFGAILCEIGTIQSAIVLFVFLTHVARYQKMKAVRHLKASSFALSCQRPFRKIVNPTYLTKNGILYDWKDIIFFNKFMPGVITAVEWCSLVHRFRIQ